MIDLHIHSTASDGTETPSRLVDLAEHAGLTAIALTDHDTVSGLDEFLQAGKNRNIRTIPGVEISCWIHSKEVHLVGLFIDPSFPPLVDFLENMRIERVARNEMIIRKLRNLGYDISEEEVCFIAKGESIGRPHIARVLVEKGYFQTIQDVFDSLLKRGGKAYIPRKLQPPDAVCSLIHDAGGLAIWAHPVSGQHSGERAFVKKMLKILIPSGLDGLETYYTTYTPSQSALLNEMIEKFQLLPSGGSDFHGSNRPLTNLGTCGGSLHVPDSLLEIMETFLEKRKNA